MCKNTQNEYNKGPIVRRSNTSIKPNTMMIEIGHTTIAYFTVLTLQSTEAFALLTIAKESEIINEFYIGIVL